MGKFIYEVFCEVYDTKKFTVYLYEEKKKRRLIRQKVAKIHRVVASFPAKVQYSFRPVVRKYADKADKDCLFDTD